MVKKNPGGSAERIAFTPVDPKRPISIVSTRNISISHSGDPHETVNGARPIDWGRDDACVLPATSRRAVEVTLDDGDGPPLLITMAISCSSGYRYAREPVVTISDDRTSLVVQCGLTPQDGEARIASSEE